ncbi:hypothetical protein L21_0014 [Methanoculleus chikugoensis]|uniref:Holin n=1 Tax=Methanoculleus chikugoensis TaxID=118126 RepID=A0A1M4MH40_9EURY|nr:hypothetical protein [Methanoculleus chikugoensis]MDD4568319.1 hypothetical protein [Methanoculleus chikugoensis]NMA10349.1 hypothetical protein [Methanomicrobiales archaeon]SCL74150.1 hypothetical protein L21_0014 [Methanoculleus chikugoensis]
MIETTWQDFAITGITVLFAVMLLPQLRDVMTRGGVLNVFTALFTSLLGYLLALVFATLGLWISVFGQGLTATVWMLLACFSLRNVRDHAFPDETLVSVALEFVTVWFQGVAFTVAGGVKEFFSRNNRG